MSKENLLLIEEVLDAEKSKEDRQIILEGLKDQIKEFEKDADADFQEEIDRVKSKFGIGGAKKKETPTVEKKPTVENKAEVKFYENKIKSLESEAQQLKMSRTNASSDEARFIYDRKIRENKEILSNTKILLKAEKGTAPKPKATPKAKATPKPKARKKTTPEQKAQNKVKVQNATGKSIEECKEILAKYEALRGKTTQKDKQRVDKLKDEDKIIDGTNVKTADAITETTAKQVPKKIKQEVDAIEKEAEKEAKEEVNPKGKTKAEVKKEVEEIKIEKIEEKVKDMTKDLADKSSELIKAMSKTISDLSPSKDEVRKFLLDIRGQVDVLLKAYKFGGAVQSYNVPWMGGQPMPSYAKGGKVEFETKLIKGYADELKDYTHFAIHKPTNSIAGNWDYKEYDKEELMENKDDYFFMDLKDDHEGNVDRFKKSDFAIITRSGLKNKGIDLNNYDVFNGQKYAKGGKIDEIISSDLYQQLRDKDMFKLLFSTKPKMRKLFNPKNTNSLGTESPYGIAIGEGRDIYKYNYPIQEYRDDDFETAKKIIASFYNEKFAKGGKFADGGKVLMEISTHKAVRNGDKIDIISKGIEIDDLKFNDEKLYSIPYENIDDLLPIFDGLEENNRINLSEYEYKKGGKLPRKKGLGWKRDRERISQEPHEQAYKSKRKGNYSSFEMGGKTMIDEEFSNVPEELEEVFGMYNEDEETYSEMKRLKGIANQRGYDFDYGLDGEPTEFWEINKMAKGGEVKDEYKDFFKRYEENEENNYHTENAIMLVSEFGTADELKRLMEIQQMHENQGYLTVEQSREQYEIQKPYYRQMFAKGGRTTRAINQDRARLSKEKHEQTYLPKRKGDYSSFDKGGKTNWVQDVVDNPSFKEDAFTRKAEARGMSTDAFMNQVLHSPNLYDERTRKQAQFMKNAFND